MIQLRSVVMNLSEEQQRGPVLILSQWLLNSRELGGEKWVGFNGCWDFVERTQTKRECS